MQNVYLSDITMKVADASAGFINGVLAKLVEA